MMMDIYHNFHFLRPLWLLSLLPVFLLWRALYRNQDSHAAWKNLIAPHLLNHLMVEHNQQARIRPIHLLLVVWGLIAISLSGPTWKREPSPFAEDSAEMIILLKVAPSMMAEDVQPFRLERARQKLHDLLEMRQGAATGLIAYSGSAHLVMPPTRDGRIVNIMANGLAPDIMPVEGDALLDALQMASTLFEQTGSVGSIVVLADSVSPEQVSNLDRLQYSAPFPLQFLSVNAIGVKMDRGLSDTANLLDAKATKLSVDSSDLEGVIRHSERNLSAVLSNQEGERWKDYGYAVVPLIVLVSLMWSRKGWKV